MDETKQGFELRQVPIADLEKPGKRVRGIYDRSAIEEYIERLEAGSNAPPADAYFDGKQYFLGDGWHRLQAKRLHGDESIECRVHEGTELDALIHEVSGRGNRDHGVRWDKRRAVEFAVRHPELGQRSNRWLADLCGVSDHTVAAVRKEVETSASTNCALPRSCESGEVVPSPRVGKDGRKRRSTNRQATSKRDRKPKALPNTTINSSTKPADDFDPVSLASPTPSISDGIAFDPAELEAASATIGDDLLTQMAEPYRRWRRLLADCSREFEKLAADEKTGIHLGDKIARIRYWIKELRDTLAMAEPTTVCPKCDGAGCNTCGRSGFWSKAIAGSRKGSAA